ncbi:hypothetical protein FAES_4544 [Fibrella aestuarina BUZ 2]|uniref:Uncharacterized protein n=1 Tax=Fibrella aestuarina BUZ 2 TaxID=1166018 RepID=I0KEJ0_9BACT|nr:hypothetical protein [Fibrella aestuarina]CCH02543.1 hypothetical protein FAES_4544 [Fibrella aestuarina BUZ 2]
MKKGFFVPLLLGASLLCGFDQPIKIVRTSTDADIRAAEKKVIRRYKNKVVITVFNRNAQQEITTIKAQRYYPAENRIGGSCKSDNFGEMVIGAASFSIKDYGEN